MNATTHTRRLPPTIASPEGTEPPKRWMCDNGAILCDDHLGASARATGRDISGQRIEPLSAEEAEDIRSILGDEPFCETCRARARRGVR